VRFKVTNTGGEAGYRFISEGNTDDGECIMIGDFIVSPSSFFLKKYESKEIQVTFRPSHEGESMEELVLQCDNQTS